MNIDRSPLREQLAGEYVLGSLRGAARTRFEKHMQRSDSVRQAVQFWEQALAPLSAPKQQAPERELWPQIEARLGWQDQAAERRLGWLPAWGFALVAMISILLWAPWQTRITPDFALDVATSADGQLRWQFAVDKRRNWIDVRVVDVPDLTAQQDVELWLLVDGGAPVSLGLLSEQDGEIQRIEAKVALAQGNGLAISLEPPGGSPTGAPTGPVIAAAIFPTG